MYCRENRVYYEYDAALTVCPDADGNEVGSIIGMRRHRNYDGKYPAMGDNNYRDHREEV